MSLITPLFTHLQIYLRNYRINGTEKLPFNAFGIDSAIIKNRLNNIML
jgi:hypothetical protein